MQAAEKILHVIYCICIDGQKYKVLVFWGHKIWKDFHYFWNYLITSKIARSFSNFYFVAVPGYLNPTIGQFWQKCRKNSPLYNCTQWIILQYVNTGKYCFILQILILGLFTEVLLISILMLSIQNLILIYWYFQNFTVSVFYILYHLLTAVIWGCLLFNSIIAN